MANILIVDDNEKIRKLIEIYIKREGHQTFLSEDGEEALYVLEDTQVDLIIADIMMPNMDGYDLVEALRSSNYNLPILMVTAKSTFQDKEKGFNTGADDYMTKPVNMDELVLRVRALLRRAKISTDKELLIGNIKLCLNSLSVFYNNEVIALPQKEFNLLFKLLSYPNKIFTRQDLMDDIWGYDSEANNRTIDVHIKRIREKFSDVEEFDIVTVRGLGYKGQINI